MPDLSVAAIGECMLELSARGDELWRMGHAGDTFNTLWALRALLPQAACDYVTAFGDDPFSDRQIAFFAAAGIGVAVSPRHAGLRPGLYAIALDGAERSFTYWRGDSAARRLADDPALLRKSLSGRTLAHFSGITLAILEPAARGRLLAALGEARAAGTRIAFDPNHRPRLWPDAETARRSIVAALAVTDIALPTFDDEAALFGDADPAATLARLHAAGVGEVVVKHGAGTALAGWTAGGGGRAEAAPPAIVPVDTTGAGDAFNGGYLAARLTGHGPAEALARAHRAAGAAVTTHGALAAPQALRAAFAG